MGVQIDAARGLILHRISFPGGDHGFDCLRTFICPDCIENLASQSLKSSRLEFATLQIPRDDVIVISMAFDKDTIEHLVCP